MRKSTMMNRGKQELSRAAQTAVRCLPASLRPLVELWSRTSRPNKEDRIKAARELGSKTEQLDEADLLVCQAVEKVKDFLRWKNHWRHSCSASSRKVVTFVGSPRDRADRMTIACAKSAYRNVIRMSVNNDSFDVQLNSEPNVLLSSYIDRDGYSRSCRFSKKVWQTKLCLPTGWLRDVYFRGIACMDGMFILQVKFLYRTSYGVECFQALAVKNSRGNDIQILELHIATSGNRYQYEKNPGAFMTLPERLKGELKGQGDGRKGCRNLNKKDAKS